MGHCLEVADFLIHISENSGDFEIDEITEILKEAAAIIYACAASSNKEPKEGLENLDPEGNA